MNILLIFTEPVVLIVQLLISAEPPLLNTFVNANISKKFVTLDTFQDPMFWLNADALRNIFCRLVIELVFQFPIAPLKLVQSKK